MTILAHVSDLHFGHEDQRLAEAALVDLSSRPVTLVVVSGDLTQRARVREFQAARAWLDRLPAPALVVPGNHDVPLFDVLRRFLQPLGRYRRYITDDLAPLFHADGLAVLGVNTARSATFKDGRISLEQIETIRTRLGPLPERVFKVLVTHHPFLPSPDDPSPALVGRGRQALEAAEAAGVHLLLAGHLHVGYSGDARAHYLTLSRSMLVVQAGTAISRRVRGEPNTYNVISVEPPHVGIEVRGWTGERFETRSRTRYLEQDGRWVKETP